MRHQPDHLASPCARWVRAYARGRARAHAHREALPARAAHRQCALHICIVFSWNCADCRRSCEVGGSWGNDISSRPMQSPVRGARRESCSSCITVACTQAARWKLLRLPKRSGSTLLRAAVLERCTTSITARRAMHHRALRWLYADNEARFDCGKGLRVASTDHTDICSSTAAWLHRWWRSFARATCTMAVHAVIAVCL